MDICEGVASTQWIVDAHNAQRVPNCGLANTTLAHMFIVTIYYTTNNMILDIFIAIALLAGQPNYVIDQDYSYHWHYYKYEEDGGEKENEEKRDNPKLSNTPIWLRRPASYSEVSNWSAEVVYSNTRKIFLSPEKFR